MRKLVLASLLLTVVACGREEEEAAVERTFRWAAPSGATVASAALLPGGEIFVGVGGELTEALFLSPAGKVVETAEIPVRAARPLVVGELAFFGPEAGGAPMYRIEPATRRVREIELENIRGLQLGAFVIDGRRSSSTDDGQLLVPGAGLVQISPEGFVTAVHRTDQPVRAITHVSGDVYAYIGEDGVLGGWRKGDGFTTSFDLPAAYVGGGDGFTVLGLLQVGAIELFLNDSPLRPLGQRFVHEIELAVAPAAQRLIVGVKDRPLDGADDVEAAAPRTALVIDGDGKVLGKVEAPSSITAVSIAADGKRAVVAHELGVIGLDVK